eukprot:scpid100581/ scgid22757/ 
MHNYYATTVHNVHNVHNNIHHTLTNTCTTYAWYQDVHKQMWNMVPSAHADSPGKELYMFSANLIQLFQQYTDACSIAWKLQRIRDNRGISLLVHFVCVLADWNHWIQ